MDERIDTFGLAAAVAAIDKAHLLDIRYLQMASIWSQNSYAVRRQVGALLVKDHMIISDGFNGTPSGFPNVCESIECTSKKECAYECNMENCKYCPWSKLTTLPYVLHAEANALTKVAKSHNSSEGATLYVTDEPCMECSKMIIQAGIKRVVYWREYHDHRGVELLNRAGVQVERIENIDIH